MFHLVWKIKREIKTKDYIQNIVKDIIYLIFSFRKIVPTMEISQRSVLRSGRTALIRTLSFIVQKVVKRIDWWHVKAAFWASVEVNPVQNEYKFTLWPSDPIVMCGVQICQWPFVASLWHHFFCIAVYCYLFSLTNRMKSTPHKNSLMSGYNSNLM